jgi:hypothetical protein
MVSKLTGFFTAPLGLALQAKKSGNEARRNKRMVREP